MKKIHYFLLINVLCALFLTGCNDQEGKAKDVDITLPQQKEQSVALLSGKFNFLLPDNLKEQSGSVPNQTNNTRVFFNDNSLRQLIVMTSPVEPQFAFPAFMTSFKQRHIDRDKATQLIKDEIIKIADHDLWRLDIIHPIKGKESYSSFLVMPLDDHLVMINLNDLSDQQAEAQNIIMAIITSIQIAE